MCKYIYLHQQDFIKENLLKFCLFGWWFFWIKKEYEV